MGTQSKLDHFLAGIRSGDCIQSEPVTGGLANERTPRSQRRGSDARHRAGHCKLLGVSGDRRRRLACYLDMISRKLRPGLTEGVFSVKSTGFLQDLA